MSIKANNRRNKWRENRRRLPQTQRFNSLLRYFDVRLAEHSETATTVKKRRKTMKKKTLKHCWTPRKKIRKKLRRKRKKAKRTPLSDLKLKLEIDMMKRRANWLLYRLV